MFFTKKSKVLKEKSTVLKEGSFPERLLKDKKSFNKTYKIKNKDTLVIDKAMLVTKIQHDIKRDALA